LHSDLGPEKYGKIEFGGENLMTPSPIFLQLDDTTIVNIYAELTSSSWLRWPYKLAPL